MTLRIICLEEHVIDDELAAAETEPADRLFPYRADLGTRYEEQPSEDPSAPTSLEGPHRAVQLAAAPLSERIDAMDAAAIDVQILSHTHQVQTVAADRAVDLVRAANDRMALSVGAHPDRFGAFAALPWQDPEAARSEAARVAACGFKGVLIAGHPAEGVMLDNPRYESVLAVLAEHGLPLYIHPGPPQPAVQQLYYAGFDRELTARLSLYGWGWHNEAGVQVVRLILAGVFDRHPGLQVISGHWGEMVPFFLQRMDDTMPREVTGLRRSIGDTYRQHVHVTPSGMFDLPHLLFCQEVLGTSRIMFSVDYPYLTMTGARRWLESLPVRQDERSAIAHGNAEALFGISPHAD